jgi:hypothetical protein
MAMIAMTINNSIRVNPASLLRCLLFHAPTIDVPPLNEVRWCYGLSINPPAGV